jgi:DNA-binding GntR family transcriptional regulator
MVNGLRDKILCGEYTAGDQLPSQRAMAHEWSTTMTTMRRVLKQLTDEGMLRVRHGLGTYVADLGQEHEGFPLSSFSEELAGKHIDIRTELVAIEVVTGNEDAVEALQLSEDSELAVLTRLRSFEQLPLIYQLSYFPGRYACTLRSHSPEIPLYAFLRDRLGLVATVYQESLVPKMLPEEAAMQLQTPPGALSLFSRKTSFSADGKPFLYDEAYIPENRMEVSIERSGKLHKVEYRLPVTRDKYIAPSELTQSAQVDRTVGSKNDAGHK